MPWIALAAGLLVLAASPARAACTDPQDLLAFENAVHRELACELADRLLGEKGCERSPVPECGAAALDQLAELVPVRFGDRLLASWGYSGALCRAALAHASELYLHELLSHSAPDPHQPAAHPPDPHQPAAHAPDAGGVPEPSAADQALSELEETCDGVDVGLRAPVGGTCAMLGEWGDVLDGPRLRGCLTQALGRIAEEVKPGSSRRPGASGHGGRPGHGRGRPGRGGERPGHTGERPGQAAAPPDHGGPHGHEHGGHP